MTVRLPHTLSSPLPCPLSLSLSSSTCTTNWRNSDRLSFAWQQKVKKETKDSVCSSSLLVDCSARLLICSGEILSVSDSLSRVLAQYDRVVHDEHWNKDGDEHPSLSFFLFFSPRRSDAALVLFDEASPTSPAASHISATQPARTLIDFDEYSSSSSFVPLISKDKGRK